MEAQKTMLQRYLSLSHFGEMRHKGQKSGIEDTQKHSDQKKMPGQLCRHSLVEMLHAISNELILS